MITCDCKKTIFLKCHKSSVFDSTDQVCRQITAVDLQKEMAVIQSVSKNVNCNIDAKCNVQTFNSPSTIERFSLDCRKTKTKVNTLANQRA